MKQVFKTQSQQQVLINISMEGPVDSYSQLIHRQQLMQQQLSNNSDLSLLSEYTALLDQKILLEQQLLSKEQPVKSEGRGGNNIAENVKKSNVSVFRKHLPREEFADLQKNCIDRYGLKSQKENTFIFFLYLHKLEAEGRITPADIQRIRHTLEKKIEKYIGNSKEKMALEGRRDFHEKNIVEFKRFQLIDVDFSQKRSFTEVSQQLKPFYLRKQVEYRKAVTRLAKVVGSDPIFQSFFTDFDQFLIKEEETGESSPPSPPHPPSQ